MHIRGNAKSVSAIGILIALEILLARFSIHTWNLKIGFSFVPIVLAAIFYGPVAGGLTAAIGDVISVVLFPVGAYFPGFTLTAFLSGSIYGIFLKKKRSVGNVVFSVLTVQAFVNQLGNTCLISFLYKSPYWPLFIARLYQTTAMAIVQIAGILLMEKKLIPILKKYENW